MASKKLNFGIHGVPLKQFEKTTANLLSTVEPQYVCLPPPLDADADWPFSQLPTSARVLGPNPGQLNNPKRAGRKEGQLRSIIRCVLRLIPEDAKRGFTVVDFGGGSGHMGIPLALLLPRCRIIVVDLRKRSLDLMHDKADIVTDEMLSSLGQKPQLIDDEPDFVNQKPGFSQCGKYIGILDNLFSYHGPVETFDMAFDMALALHLCGEATDVTLRKAAHFHATIVVAPCCVGKLSQKTKNPDVYNATGQNNATVSYPQSTLFCRLIPNQDDFDALAKAADYSNEQESRTSLNATRRTAKALLETDRRLYLEERYQYKTALMRMDPWEVTPKNDILVAWKDASIAAGNLFSKLDANAQSDIQVAKKNLILISADSTQHESSDWTREEEEEIQKSIKEFLDSTEGMVDQIYCFPTRMGRRKRKLIHFVAEKFNLAHWSRGKKDCEKTVAIARRGRRKRKGVTESD